MATDLPRLSEQEIKQRLGTIDGWDLDADSKLISKTVVLGNFTEAAIFISKIAPLADGMNHHPDVLLHKFKRVKVMLWTHSVDGLTENDFELAAKIDELSR